MTGVDTPTNPVPGTGLHVTDGTPEPVQVHHLDDATVALILRDLLVGGMPGAGKSALLNLMAAHAALTGEDRPVLAVFDPKHDTEGGIDGADPGR